MVLTPAQYPALKTELTNDPKGLGLTAALVETAAAKLNQPGASGDTIGDRRVVESWEVMGCIDGAEWEARHFAWSLQEKAYFDALVAGGTVDASSTRVRAKLGSLFPNASAPLTRTALLALIDRPCSRGEKLFGVGVVVGPHDVQRARDLT